MAAPAAPIKRDPSACDIRALPGGRAPLGGPGGGSCSMRRRTWLRAWRPALSILRHDPVSFMTRGILVPTGSGRERDCGPRIASPREEFLIPRACLSPALVLGGLVLWSIALWPGASAFADPSGILDHLRSTPASQLDLSLARLGALVDNAGSGAGFGGFAAVEDKEIVIRAYAPAAKPDKASCRAIMDRIKRAGGVDPKTGQPDDPASAYASLFSYPDTDQSKIDISYDETVDSMITIMVVIGETGDGQGMVCQSRLLSPEITYQKQ
jgi:hypothetical protein